MSAAGRAGPAEHGTVAAGEGAAAERLARDHVPIRGGRPADVTAAFAAVVG